MRAFDLAFHDAGPHGVISAVHLPDGPAPVPDVVLARLHDDEAAFARDLTGYRQVSFVGGRLAARAAAQQLGVDPGPILPDDRGAPTWSEGLVGSISHKSDLAVALVARDQGATVGVDIEDYAPARPGVARKVLTKRELDAIAHLPEDRRWIATLLRFSLKEALYKALDPFVRRYVGFHEAEVTPDVRGGAEVSLALERGEGPFAVDARYTWTRGRILTSVRVRRS